MWEEIILNKNILAIGIIFLFIGSSITPMVIGYKVEPQYDVISWDDEWPKFHHDSQNTGYSTSIAPQTNTILWTYTTGFEIVSSPAVVNDRVYIGSDDEYFYCLDADTGEKLWDYPIPGGTGISSPAVYAGKVYVGTTYYYVYCWDADTGDLIWKYPKEYGSSSSPAVVDGKVYIGLGEYSDGKIYCLNASTGEKIWSFIIGGKTQVSSSPVVADGKVYIGSYDRRLYCLDADNGSKLWDFDTDWKVPSSPAVADGKVYVGGGGLYCLDAETGEELWCFNGRTCCSPAVAYGSIYFVGRDGKVYCVDAESGDELWNYTTSDYENSISSPAVADGKVYVGIWSNGKLLCLDAYTGEFIWDYLVSVPDWLFSSPAVAYGRVYIGGDMSYKVYCFEDPSQPPEAPIIKGPASGKAGVEYDYTFVTIDPNDDDVYYYIEWGDGNVEEWIGPYNSSEEITLGHSWEENGTYIIKAKAKDTYDIESHWTELVVTMPRNKVLYNSYLLRFLEQFPNAFLILRQLLGL